MSQPYLIFWFLELKPLLPPILPQFFLLTHLSLFMLLIPISLRNTYSRKFSTNPAAVQAPTLGYDGPLSLSIPALTTVGHRCLVMRLCIPPDCETQEGRAVCHCCVPRTTWHRDSTWQVLRASSFTYPFNLYLFSDYLLTSPV